jgi:hypothetical protein
LETRFGAASAEITRTAAANGTYLLVIGDGTSGLGGSGNYRLSVNGLYAGIKWCPPVRLGGLLRLQGAGGSANGAFVVLTTTNVTTPAPMWTPILTNNFGIFGEFIFTNAIDFNLPEQYFRLREP